MAKATVTGQTFGQLTVLADDPTVFVETRPWVTWAVARDRRVLVRCTCGMTKSVGLSCLRRGNTRSCGRAPCRRRVHGRTSGEPPVLYRLWCNIKARCYNERNPSYRHYGGRGIHMWSGWTAEYRCFEQDILAEIGEHPGQGYSIDRIDSDGNYEPGNVRWANQSMQQRNKRRRR